MGRHPLRTALALAGAAVLVLPAAAQARDIYMTDAAGDLIRVDSRFPGEILDRTPVTGLPAGVSLVGIDFRPATGDLVGVGSNSVVYTVSPETGAATAIGTGFTPGLAGAAFGVDVNPVPDALRITSDAEQNHRISFASGNHGAGSPDGALNPGDPSVVAAAYTNSLFTATRPTTTQLFVLDAATDRLLLQNPPNAGTLTEPRPLGVDIGPQTGFDIAGAGNTGYMVTTPAGRRGAVLYQVDLATGGARELGPVGTGSLVRSIGTPRLTITGLAARQETVAPRVNVPPSLSVVATTNRPRPGQRAAYLAKAADSDGEISRIEWDTDGDGAFDDARGGAQRLAFPAGRHTFRVRATDSGGARTVATFSVTVAR
ncbi:MAG TPA: DUF4394 domain-containing protein [Miltoncostaeaceae bacterium]|nr:DUF4394 domain-containing protein [Miltoncostaeaceae bacterium]